MPHFVKRMRLFAGPNGSGKSTIIHSIRSSYYMGIYLNADDIERTCRDRGFINVGDYNIQITSAALEKFLLTSTLKRKSEEEGFPVDIVLENNIIKTGNDTHSYEAALIADFLRLEFLRQGKNFSFETVMSHPSKLEILKQAATSGYKNYLYFIATDSPEINIQRIDIRVKKGGHGVPVNKIVDRYYRSLSLLSEAIPYTYRTYIFDNSGTGPVPIAEVEGGINMIVHEKKIPHWFYKYVIGKMK